MKPYYYLVYRIYCFYKETLKEKDGFGISASMVVTVLMSSNLLSIIFILKLLKVVPTLPNKFIVIIVTILIWLLNYFGFMRGNCFLDMQFTKNRFGDFGVVVYILVSLFALFFLAHLVRISQ